MPSGAAKKDTFGNKEKEQLSFFKMRKQEFWQGMRMGRFTGVDDMIQACEELVNLAEDMDLFVEIKEWRITFKKLSCIKEEFGTDGNAWLYVQNAFGDKGSLKAADIMEMNRDIAKISRIRGINTYQQKWGTGRGGYPIPL